MKNLIAIVVLLIVLSLLASCFKHGDNLGEAITTTGITLTEKNTVSNTTSNKKNDEFELKQQKEVEKVMEKISDKPLGELLKNKFDEKDLIENYLFHNYNPLMSHQLTLTGINFTHPIECLRLTSNQRIYNVYDTDNGSRLFTFFVGEDIKKTDGVLYSTAIIYESLMRNDFDKIDISLYISDVEKIDKVASLYKSLAHKYELETFESKHLLKDGLLVIQYSLNDEKKYVVSNIEFYDDFKLVVKDDILGEIIYDYQILPQDYPT